MEKNLVIVENYKKYEADSFEEVENLFFGRDYRELPFEEKFKVRYNKAFPYCMMYDLQLVDTRVGLLGANGEVKSQEYNFEKAFIIDNEKAFILSLCKFAGIVLLEHKDSNIFNIQGIARIKDDDNYIVINNIANELMLLNLKK